MTPFDQYVTPQSLQMIKLIIPFFPSQTQRMLAISVKFLELRHTLSFFHSMKQQDFSFDHMMDYLKPYLSASDLESFDQMVGMMNMMSMMQDMPEMDFGIFTEDNNTEPPKEGETNE